MESGADLSKRDVFFFFYCVAWSSITRVTFQPASLYHMWQSSIHDIRSLWVKATHEDTLSS